MPRFHATSEGNIQFSSEEEAQRDAEEKAWSDGADARKMAEIRRDRDLLLSNTDWWGASDNAEMSSSRKAYRLALRNYPATYTADNSADWPTVVN